MNTRVAALIAAVTVVVTAVVAVVVWRMSSEPGPGSGPSRLAQAQVRSEFTRQPVVGWRLPVAAAAPDGLVKPEFGNAFGYDRSAPGVIDLGDTVIVGVIDSESPGAVPTMVAVDTGTGDIRWRAPGDPRSCADAAVAGLLPCVVGTSDGRIENAVSMIRVADGRVERRLPVPAATEWGGVRGVRVLGDRVFVAYRTSITGSTVASGSVTDLTAHWVVSHTLSGTQCFGTGDALYFQVGTDFVNVGNDAAQMVVRTSDGALVSDHWLASVQQRPGQGLIATRCGSEEPGSPRDLLVYDTSGKLLRQHGSVRSGFTGFGITGTARTDAPYRVGTVVTDYATGEPAWPAAGSFPADVGESLTMEGIGDRALVVYPHCTGCGENSSGDVVAGYSLGEGHNLWPDAGEQLSYRDWLTDGVRLIWLDGKDVAALDTGTGRRAWAVPAGTSDPDFSGPGALYRAGKGFVVRTKEYLTYFRP